MPDKEKEITEKNYIKQYVGESGYVYDLTNKRKQLANEAYERYTEQKEDKELQQYAEEQYITTIYPNETDEYLVETAILTCTMATIESKIYRGENYSVTSPSTTTGLKVTKNKDASCSGGLYYATVKDSKKNDNIPPFQCNCILAPYTNEDWKALETDETCLKEGTCKALMNLNEEWDNLPRVDGEAQQINGISAINMGSILFCRHGGIIYPVDSGQDQNELQYNIEDVLDKVTVERINKLHPMIRQATIDFICRLQVLYPGVRIAQGLRTFEEQNALFSQGRNGNSGQIVTNAKGGQSLHNYGLAIDIVNIVGNEANYDFDWQQVSDIGKECGFEWGGDWTTFKDLPHFQMTYGYSVEGLLEKYNQGEVENGYVVLE